MELAGPWASKSETYLGMKISTLKVILLSFRLAIQLGNEALIS